MGKVEHKILPNSVLDLDNVSVILLVTSVSNRSFNFSHNRKGKIGKRKQEMLNVNQDYGAFNEVIHIEIIKLKCFRNEIENEKSGAI